MGTDRIKITPTTAPTQKFKWPDGRAPYKLEGSQRVEMVTATIAMIRNQERKRVGTSGRWVLYPECTPDEVTRVPNLTSYDEFKSGLARGRQQDHRLTPNAVPKEKEATPMAKDKKDKKSDDESGRKKWNGHGMCDLLRWMGHDGMTDEQGKAVMDKLGFEPSETTLHISMKRGRNGIPKVKTDLADELRAIAAKVKPAKADDDKPAKKDKAEKSDRVKVKKDKPAEGEGKSERVKVKKDKSEKSDSDKAEPAAAE